MELDYFDYQASGDFINDPAKAVTIKLSVRDNDFGLGMAIFRSTKTQPLKYILESIVSFFDSEGHPQVTTREAEEIKTTDAAKDWNRTLRETTPRYSSCIGSRTRHSPKVMQNDVLTLRYVQESEDKCHIITPELTIWPFLWPRHAAVLRGRYDLESNGITASEEYYHTDYKDFLVQFNENVFYQVMGHDPGHVPGGQRQYKGDPVKHIEIFLGKTTLSNKVFIGTNGDSVITVGSIRRREYSTAYDFDEPKSRRGVHWAYSEQVIKPRTVIMLVVLQHRFGPVLPRAVQVCRLGGRAHRRGLRELPVLHHRRRHRVQYRQRPRPTTTSTSSGVRGDDMATTIRTYLLRPDEGWKRYLATRNTRRRTRRPVGFQVG